MSGHQLKARLPRTWGAFFGRYGNFTPIQLQAIPLLLDGYNVLLHAGTASGKTEAALAPLIEHHLPPDRPDGRLTLLYLVPTRALINDVFARLASSSEVLRIRMAVKSRDDNTFNLRHPADVLLTTPESLDSLLATETKTLIHVRAVVIDELHTFDASVRGDQLRVLLRRLRALRTYAAVHGDTENDQIQYAALSATLAQPEIIAAHYFPNAQIASTSGGRPLQIELLPLDENLRELFEFLNTFRDRGWKKALVFCNTRAEVEMYAAHTHNAHTPFGGVVYVHYSNLDRIRRHEIETEFAQAEAAICFASSTLELGIDIGSIDVVVLIGAPGSVEAFTQRIGRASRRQKTAYATCFYRNSLERCLFDALATYTNGFTLPTPFRPSVAVQQIFSLLQASPTGGIRTNPTAALFDGLLTRSDLVSILGALQEASYLQVGRPDEWRAGDRLNRLVDLQAAEQVPMSLYSNLKISTDTVSIRDQHSQRIIAKVDRLMLNRDELLLEGKRLNVEWTDDKALWVTSARDDIQPTHQTYRSARPLLSFELAQAIPIQFGLRTRDAPLMQIENGWIWFHCLGDIYGRAVSDLLSYTTLVTASDHPGLSLYLSEEITRLPAWAANQVRNYLLEHYRIYERILALGAYHPLLSADLRRRAVIDQFDIARFLNAVQNLHVVRANETLTEVLHALIQTQNDE